jgi:hypothetical protein
VPRRRRRPPVQQCRACGTERLSHERFAAGCCPSCRFLYGKERRAETAARLLARARDGGSEERDGQTLHVLVLPPRGRRRR